MITSETAEQLVQRMLREGMSEQALGDRLIEICKDALEHGHSNVMRSRHAYYHAAYQALEKHMAQKQDEEVQRELAMDAKDYAEATVATTVGELKAMLAQLEHRWTDADTAEFGPFNSQVLNYENQETRVIKPVHAQYTPHNGLVMYIPFVPSEQGE